MASTLRFTVHYTPRGAICAVSRSPVGKPRAARILRTYDLPGLAEDCTPEEFVRALLVAVSDAPVT